MSGAAFTPPLNESADDGKTYYDTSDLPDKGKPTTGRVVGYFTNWSRDRPGDCAFEPKDVDGNLLTHVNFSFAKVDGGSKENPSFKLAASDPRDLGADGWYRKLTAIKQKYPHLKVLLAVGGWAHNDPPNGWLFTTMVATAKYRHEFISSALSLLREYGFDGLDVDWEYPGSGERGGFPADRKNYVTFLAEFHAAARAEAKQSGKPELLLTAATPSSSYFLAGYDLEGAQKHLDWINLMTYDYYGSWNSQAGANAPFLADSTPNGNASVKASVQRYLDAGVPAHKIVLGMPTYGRSFKGVQVANLSSISTGPGAKGRCTGEAGTVSYYEVQELIRAGKYSAHWDGTSGTPFAYSADDKTMISFDDEKSLGLKASYVREKGLGGAMFWAIDLDDFRNGYPLISHVYRQLRAK
jgi:chitinase